MSEQDLVRSMLSIASARGIDSERAAEEIANAQFPSFIDQRAVRSALVTHVEEEMRRQMERRIDDLRRRFDVDAAPGAKPAPVASTAAPSFAPPPAPATPTPAPSPAPIVATPAPKPAAPATPLAPTPPPGANTSYGDATQIGQDLEPLPSDATMVWTTRPRNG